MLTIALSTQTTKYSPDKRVTIIELLKKGGFRLQKWANNTPDLLSDLNLADHGLAQGSTRR